MKLALVDHAKTRIVFGWPGTGYCMLAEYAKCALGNQTVQLYRLEVLMRFHKRCSQCLLKILCRVDRLAR